MTDEASGSLYRRGLFGQPGARRLGGDPALQPGGKRGTGKIDLPIARYALEALKEPCEVLLYTDSQYIAKAINEGWLRNWKRNGWKKSDKKPVLNVELWQALDAQLQRHQVQIHWVKGHADNAYNNRCDQLATGEIAKNR